MKTTPPKYSKILVIPKLNYYNHYIQLSLHQFFYTEKLGRRISFLIILLTID